MWTRAPNTKRINLQSRAVVGTVVCISANSNYGIKSLLLLLLYSAPPRCRAARIGCGRTTDNVMVILNSAVSYTDNEVAHCSLKQTAFLILPFPCSMTSYPASKLSQWTEWCSNCEKYKKKKSDSSPPFHQCSALNYCSKNCNATFSSTPFSWEWKGLRPFLC